MRGEPTEGKLSSLAWEIAKCLQQLVQSVPAGGAGAAAGPTVPVAFFADCGCDLSAVRERLATELRIRRAWDVAAGELKTIAAILEQPLISNIPTPRNRP